jgi:hypothetical protein
MKYKNNGFIFRPEDWDRLKKIAEGNPDEQKVFTYYHFSLISFFKLKNFFFHDDLIDRSFWCGLLFIVFSL